MPREFDDDDDDPEADDGLGPSRKRQRGSYHGDDAWIEGVARGGRGGR